MLLSGRPRGQYMWLGFPKRGSIPHWGAQARLPAWSSLKLSPPHFLHFPPFQSQPEFHLHQAWYPQIRSLTGRFNTSRKQTRNFCRAPRRVEDSWLHQMEKRTQKGSTCKIQPSCNPCALSHPLRLLPCTVTGTTEGYAFQEHWGQALAPQPPLLC